MSALSFSTDFKPEKDLALHFIEISDAIAQTGAIFGIKIIPYRDPALMHFIKLKEKKKLQVLKAVYFQLEFFKAASSEGLHPNSPQLIWRIFSKMGIIPQSDIFDKMSEEDTIEVYHTGDSTSSFKNLKFFEFVSLSIEELYTLPWMDQWEVSSKIFLMFLETQTKINLAQYKRTFSPIFHHYQLREKLGEKRTFNIHLKWMSPIIFNGERKAIVVINRSSFAL